jgi:hypothetical protein
LSAAAKLSVLVVSSNVPVPVMLTDWPPLAVFFLVRTVPAPALIVDVVTRTHKLRRVYVPEK